MSAQKGFTLVEILTALVILSILALIAVPIYSSYMEQGSANAAQNNLIAIYNAEKTYYLSSTGSGTYCTSATAICTSETSINTNLGLNITDPYFNYSCSNAAGFTCTATNVSDATFVLTVLETSSIVLPNTNPSCTYPAHPSYCPS